MKKEKKVETANVKINSALHEQVLATCRKEGMKIGAFVERSIEKHLMSIQVKHNTRSGV